MPQQAKKNMKTIQGKNAQAALEYIITYGWGFIVILVVLGGLAYFGYLNPTRYVPSRCAFGVQLECADYRIDAAKLSGSPSDNGNITLVLLNNFGADINITQINAASGISGRSYNPPNNKIPKGGTNNFSLTLSIKEQTLLVEGDRATIPLVITFQRADIPGSPLHNITGEVFATVQPRNN